MQSALEVGGDSGGFIPQLAPGDARQPPTLGEEDPVPFAVPLEGTVGPMYGATISRWACQRQSASMNSPRSETVALNRGRGSPCASRKATNLSSKSLRVIPSGSLSVSSSRKVALPRRPG